MTRCCPGMPSLRALKNLSPHSSSIYLLRTGSHFWVPTIPSWYQVYLSSHSEQPTSSVLQKYVLPLLWKLPVPKPAFDATPWNGASSLCCLLSTIEFQSYWYSCSSSWPSLRLSAFACQAWSSSEAHSTRLASSLLISLCARCLALTSRSRDPFSCLPTLSL